MTLLKAEHITKSYAGVHALRDASFELRPGEVHALVGENGAGKSTLVKIISGVYSPDMGNVCWEGQKITAFSPSHARRLGIGIVHQESALLPDFSVAANFVTLHIGVEYDYRDTCRNGFLHSRRKSCVRSRGNEQGIDLACYQVFNIRDLLVRITASVGNDDFFDLIGVLLSIILDLLNHLDSE